MARMFHNKWSCFIKLKYLPALFIEENVPMNFHFAMAKLFYLFYLIISQTIPKLCVNWAFYLCKKLYTKHFTFSFEWKQDERSKGHGLWCFQLIFSFSWNDSVGEIRSRCKLPSNSNKFRIRLLQSHFSATFPMVPTDGPIHFSWRRMRTPKKSCTLKENLWILIHGFIVLV